MLIVNDDPEHQKEINFIDNQYITKAQYANFTDIRWHRVSLINHEIIILIPDNIDISYHLKYLQMTSDATIIVITSNQTHISKMHRSHVFCFEPIISKDFFSGCLMTLMQKRHKLKHRGIDFINTLHTGKFVLTNLQQVVLLSRAIAQSSNNSPQLRRGIYELLLNAFEHGIYQLGFELKQELISNKKYFSELNKRIRDPAFKNKNIELIIHKKENGICINITDPGLGFDYHPYLSFNKNLSDSKSGRGISYAANYCFDQLIYKNEGRSVFAVLNNVGSG